MLYYIKETVFDEQRQKTAASKAREDINTIAEELGFNPINVEYDYSLRTQKSFAAALNKLTQDWDKALSSISDMDILLIQFPLNHHPMSIGKGIDKLHERGGRVIFLIHDIDSLRMKKDGIIQRLKYCKVKVEDNEILRRGDAVIAHNPKMMAALAKYKVNEDKLISLGIFDYLQDETRRGYLPQNDVVIAGTLRKHKAGYVYSLPSDVQIGLYGVGYEDQHKDNIKYYGSFNPVTLVGQLSGKFGLVWDGSSSETCEGLSGAYLKINNPHKTSLYLSAGIPVMVWEQAAIADFVIKNKCGIVIKKLGDIKSVLDNLNDEDYKELRNNAQKLSERISNGYYASQAISSAIVKIQG